MLKAWQQPSEELPSSPLLCTILGICFPDVVVSGGAFRIDTDSLVGVFGLFRRQTVTKARIPESRRRELTTDQIETFSCIRTK